MYDTMTKDAAKQALRDQVFDHLFSEGHPQTICTLPGPAWSLENRILDCSDASLVCFEKEPAVQDQSYHELVKPVHRRLEDMVPHGDFGHRQTTVYEGERVTYIHSDMLRFTEGAQPYIRKSYGDWEGAWLDFCGPLSEKLSNTWKSAMSFFSDSPDLPVAMTILGCRESGRFKGVTSRVDELFNVINEGRKFRPAWDHKYISETSKPMYTLAGYLC